MISPSSSWVRLFMIAFSSYRLIYPCLSNPAFLSLFSIYLIFVKVPSLRLNSRNLNQNQNYLRIYRSFIYRNHL